MDRRAELGKSDSGDYGDESAADPGSPGGGLLTAEAGQPGRKNRVPPRTRLMPLMAWSSVLAIHFLMATSQGESSSCRT